LCSYKAITLVAIVYACIHIFSIVHKDKNKVKPSILRTIVGKSTDYLG